MDHIKTNAPKYVFFTLAAALFASARFNVFTEENVTFLLTGLAMVAGVTPNKA